MWFSSWNYCLLFNLLAFSVVSGAHAETNAPNPSTAPSNIVVIVLGDPFPLAEKVAAHIGFECEWPARCEHRDCTIRSSAQAQVKAIVAEMKPSDLCVLALINKSKHESLFRSAQFCKEGVALLAVDPLRQNEAGEQVSSSVLESRVKKESMRALGLLFGLRDCPWPRCCMLPSETDAQLDSKGQDFCPPCQAKLERILLNYCCSIGQRAKDDHGSSTDPSD
jgi:predicted Zn-dependent protease